ncbi:hypothetical protein LN040_10675 [Desulfovibrio subterraneus]|uniref:hypothetical protein n=1 Tax=Desulfovibrio subterraneus TaxID=2718620 RepID=UPI0022B8E027|nr:hypothetical protein [Desulfovibrio subterraneus]WBF66192.1 hypothetical protein LN040_10675 [Desulfovibrio subterraneus]
MKIAYVASLGNPYFTGVCKKIEAQIAVWCSFPGIVVEPFVRAVNGLETPWEKTYLLKGAPALCHDSELLQDIKAFRPDVVYLRHEICGPQIISLLRAFPGKVVVEINADLDAELKLEARESLRRFVAYSLNKLTKRYFEKRVAATVCVASPLMSLFESLPAARKFLSPNAIDLRNHAVMKSVPDADTRKSLVFAGTPGQAWHGVDLLLPLARALPCYDFHIFGPSPLPDAPGNMIFHGYQPKEVLEQFYAQCHVGIGTLAAFRQGLAEASTLKVREYIAAGLPVILGYRDSAFLQSSPPWVLELSSQERLFEQEWAVEAVRDFVERNARRVVTHADSAQYIDASILEGAKIEQFRRWFAQEL